jgi:hypothetical protein
MFLIIADPKEDSLDLDVRRDLFWSESFVYCVTDNQRQGIVLLHDGGEVHVGASRGDYPRICILEEDGALVGTLLKSPDDRVHWIPSTLAL